MSSKNTKEALLYNILLLISIVIIFILGYNLGFLNQVKEVQLVMQTIILVLFFIFTHPFLM